MKKTIKLEPLESIKRLLILQLAISGVNSDVIADALEVDSSTIRKIVSMRKAKKSKTA